MRRSLSTVNKDVDYEYHTDCGSNRLGWVLDNYDLNKKKVRPEHRARRYIRAERNSMEAMTQINQRIKRRRMEDWIEAFSSGVITGAVIMSLVFYWLVK